MNAFVHRDLEAFTRVTPFGARFWDAAAGRFVADGLRLAARLRGQPHARAVASVRNPSGVLLLSNLPGLRQAESGAGDEAYWDALAATSPPGTLYDIELADEAGRFLPYAFTAPLPARGLFALDWPALAALPVSPPAARIAGLPLFSAPGRPVPAGLAVVRAQLCEHATGRMAAWARVDVHCQGRWAGLGMADADGRVAVLFAYPEPQPKRLGSASPPPRVPEAGWSVRLEAYYAPPPAGAQPPRVPDLHAFLAQPPATLLAATAPPTPLGELPLHRGAELTAKSAGSSCLFL